MSDTEATAKKPGKKKKILLFVLLALLIGGGGVAGGLYASGGIGGGGPAEDPNKPKLVARGDASASDIASATAAAERGRPDPRLFQATYHPMENQFTANLQDNGGFIQLSLGVATYYDSRVIERLTAHDMAVRSAVLMVLSQQDSATLSTAEGKEALKGELKNAINNTLTNKEGFGGIDDVYFTSLIMQ